MRRVRTLIFVFLIIIIAAVVGYVAYNQYIVKPAEAVVPAYVEVYIAAQPIPQGGKITAELLGTIKDRSRKRCCCDVHNRGTALACGQVGQIPLEQGVVITEAMVGESAAAIPGPQWAALIPPGMTAMSIPADRFSLSGYAVNSGAHVNLNACFLFVDIDPTFQTILPNQTAVLVGTGFGTVTGDRHNFGGIAHSDSWQCRLRHPTRQVGVGSIPSTALLFGAFGVSASANGLPDDAAGYRCLETGRFLARCRGDNRNAVCPAHRCGRKPSHDRSSRSCHFGCPAAGFGHAFLPDAHRRRIVAHFAEPDRPVQAGNRSFNIAVPA